MTAGTLAAGNLAFENIVGLVLAVALMVFLVLALLYAERL
ncbi:MAG: K(+)-transporting ATPase subunit F [Acidimicrobiales bacterium]